MRRWRHAFDAILLVITVLLVVHLAIVLWIVLPIVYIMWQVR